MSKDLKAALHARKKPEPEPTIPIPPEPEKAETPEKKKRKFHTTLYIDRPFYNRIKMRLIEEGDEEGNTRDFNELVNSLLRDWYGEDGE